MNRVMLAALAATLSCSSPPGTKTGTAGSTGTAKLDASVDIVSGSFAPDADPFAAPAPDAAPRAPEGLTANPPPEVSCSADADVASACDLPPSKCAYSRDCDAGADVCIQWSSWIAYYEHPRCVEGRCVWDQSFFTCDSASTCRAGACVGSLSTS